MHRISVDHLAFRLPRFTPMPDDATTQADVMPEYYPWINDLLGVLPATAFIDTVDSHRRLHICQLVGTVPIWSWTVTPTAYKTLLGTSAAKDETEGHEDDDDQDEQVRPCHLDGFGQTPPWTATDGGHGYQHVVANAETLRRCLTVSPRRTIANLNPSLKGPEARIHRLEFIRVSPRPPTTDEPGHSFSSTDNGGLGVDSTARLATIVTAGWAILAGCLGAALKTRHLLGAAYLVIVALTGLCVQILHGSQPRALLHGTPSGINRMVIVSEHSNATSWKVFYGDSALLKSLLRHPLTSEYASLPRSVRGPLRLLLRALILAQWAAALTAAVKRGGDGILICLWVLVSLVASRYFATPAMGARIWMRSYAGVVMERYQLKLSCRLSLLSTLVALNPDTPPFPSGEDAGTAAASKDPMGWLDTVWRDGSSRRHWEEAVRRALTETFQRLSVAKVASSGHRNEFWQSLAFMWQGDGKGGENESVDRTLVAETEEEEWLASIEEGLNMAARIQAEAERLVSKGKEKAQADSNDTK